MLIDVQIYIHFIGSGMIVSNEWSCINISSTPSFRCKCVVYFLRLWKFNVNGFFTRA